jgi:hypothetical protein
MKAYLGRNILLINKNVCLCDSSPSIFICKHHKQDATPQDLQIYLNLCLLADFDKISNNSFLLNN